MPSCSPIRLATIDPARAAAEAFDRVSVAAEAARAALGLPAVRIEPESTPVFRRVRALAAYAVGAAALPRNAPTPTETVMWLLPLLQLSELSREPASELETALQASLAREALDAGEALSAVQLALLAGYDRDHVLAMASGIPGAYRSDESKRRPWRFRVTRQLRAWIADRVAGRGDRSVA